jgi:S-formylglutathione hydrolase FrmB
VSAGCSAGPPGYSNLHGSRLVHYTLTSRLVHHDLSELAIVPPGGGRRPLLVLLHGRTNNWNGPRYNLSQQLLDALAGEGRRAQVVVLLNGGPHSYYHDRRDGAWGSMSLREGIPDAVRRFRTLPGKIAIGGISMGGYGALHLAETQPSLFCAVGVRAPAVWRTGGETAPGAFDDAADFARNDIIAGASRLAHLPIWIDHGDHDPFVPGDDVLASRLHAQVHVWPGGHTTSYWNAHEPQFLAFFARACR